LLQPEADLKLAGFGIAEVDIELRMFEWRRGFALRRGMWILRQDGSEADFSKNVATKRAPVDRHS
jgi:hypothetical protein